MIADLRDMQISLRDSQGLAHSLVKKLEANGLFIDNVRRGFDGRPVIYAITPTFARPVQKAELTRLAQTFLHIPNFHWIVVEDATNKSGLVSKFLETSSLIYTHLSVATPPNYKLGRNDPNWKKPRGVAQRNMALRWIRENLKLTDKGIVFFADDDNTYAIKLFHEVNLRGRINFHLQLYYIILRLPFFFLLFFPDGEDTKCRRMAGRSSRWHDGRETYL